MLIFLVSLVRLRYGVIIFSISTLLLAPTVQGGTFPDSPCGRVGNACKISCACQFGSVGTPTTDCPQPGPLNQAKYSSCQLNCNEEYQSCQSGQQSAAQEVSAKLNQSASSSSAATGVVFMAEGANNLDGNSKTAGVLIVAGQAALKTASLLKENELKGKDSVEKMKLSTEINALAKTESGLTADEKVINSKIAEGIFTSLEEKYNIVRSEFIQKMLSTRGNSDSLESLLEGKGNAKKLSIALAAASELL